MKKCKKCLSQLEDNVNFCSECGSADFELSDGFIKQEVKLCTQFTEWSTTQRQRNGQVGKRWAQQPHQKQNGQINLQRRVYITNTQ